MASSIDAIPTKSLEILLECSVCLETLNDPRTLACFHSFCKGCLETFVQGRRDKNENPDVEVNTFECPVCRSEFTLNTGEGVEGIGANYFIRSMLDVMAVENHVKVIPCRHCKNASAGRCVNCEIFICEGCIQAHNNYLANQNHSVLSMDELSKPENRSKIRGKPRCMEHDDEILKFFCETCEELICRDCKDDNHAEHQSSSVKKAAEQKTEELKGWCVTLTDEFNKSNEALQAMNNVVQVLDDNVQGAKKKIRQRKDEILATVGRILDKKEKSLTKKIDMMFQNKNEALSEQLGIAQVYANQVKSSIDVCKSLLENGDVVEIVSSHALVGKNIEKVKTEHPESWNPVNDGSIGFNQCSMNDFQMEIQQLSGRLGKIKGKTSNKDCSICQSPMTNPKVLTRCGHSFCAPCIDKAFTYKKTCPICQEVYGITEGDQPDGTIVMAPSYVDNNGVKGSERSGSSSSVVYDTQPYLAWYIQNIHNKYLKSIEQQYNVAITWSPDGTKVQIKASSTPDNNQHFKLACEKFIEMYKNLYDSVTKVSFDVKKEDKRFGKGNLKNAVCSVPNIIPGLMLEKAVDGITYTLWGTNTSLANGQEWIRRQLEIPSGLKTRSQSSNALTHETANKLKVVVYEGDITRENTDIIVNACNEHLDHGGGVSFALAKAAGHSFQQESDNYVKKHGVLSTGDVAVTGSGYLKCKKVLHAVGPQWKKHGKDTSIKLLKKIFDEVYQIALTLNAKSVAMPAISSGIFGVPKDVCAKTTFSFVDELDQHLGSNNAGPFEIRLVNIDVETVQVFCQEFHKWLLKGKKVERRHSFNSGIKKEPEKQPARNRSADDTHKPLEIKGSLLKVTARFQNMSSKRTPGTSTTSDPTSVYRQLPNPSSPSGQQQNQEPNLSATHAMQSGNRQPVNGRPEALPNPFSSSMSARNIPVGQNGLNSPATTPGETSNKDCSICQSAMTNPKVLTRCGHSFCAPCIDRAFTYKKTCPICQEVYGITEGDEPDGTMTVEQSQDSLPGYEGCGSYIIKYHIPSGKQDNRHPNPGKWFTGAVRRAYLPATKEGKVVLALLQKAFDKKLTFTVGRSTTTGKEDCVTWNDIHHKTSVKGGPQRFGYPDPDYLRRVKDELKSKGIVPD